MSTSPLSFSASPPSSPPGALSSFSPRSPIRAAIRPPSSSPPLQVVDKAMNEAVSRLARLLEQRGGSVLETDLDAHDLLKSIQAHLHRIGKMGRAGADNEQEDATSGGLDAQDAAVQNASCSPPRHGAAAAATAAAAAATAEPSTTPFDLWRARRLPPPSDSPRQSSALSSKITAQQASSLVERLNDSLRRHKVQVASAQQDILAAEMANLTFRPSINAKSKHLAILLPAGARRAD
jgi:hypothetical protein